MKINLGLLVRTLFRHLLLVSVNAQEFLSKVLLCVDSSGRFPTHFGTLMQDLPQEPL